jgi:hypothetical protein
VFVSCRPQLLHCIAAKWELNAKKTFEIPQSGSAHPTWFTDIHITVGLVLLASANNGRGTQNTWVRVNLTNNSTKLRLSTPVCLTVMSMFRNCSGLSLKHQLQYKMCQARSSVQPTFYLNTLSAIQRNTSDQR